MIKRKSEVLKKYKPIKTEKKFLNFYTKVGMSMAVTLVVTVGSATLFMNRFNDNNASPSEVLSESTTNLNTFNTEIYNSGRCSEEDFSDLLWFDNNYDYKKEISISKHDNFDQNKAIEVAFNHEELVQSGKSNADGSDIRVVKVTNNNFERVSFNGSNFNSSSARLKFLTDTSNSKYYIYYSILNTESDSKSLDNELNDSSSFSATVLQESTYPLKAELNKSKIIKGIDELTLTANLDPKIQDRIQAVNYELTGTELSSVILSEDGTFASIVDLSEVDSGKHTLVTSIKDECYKLESNAIDIEIVIPTFVTWTMDWEGYKVNSNFLTQIDSLADKYTIPITQFYNPRVYLPNAVSSSERDQIHSWINMRASKGDEIGLHLHMWNDMVRAAGITPKISPSWSNMNNGYDVIFSAYNEEESKKILEWAMAKMKEQGFEELYSFRSGGWEIDEENLKAVDKLGFKVDSSGRTNHQLGANLISSKWDLQPDTQPYHPSIDNINAPGELNLNLLEIPNNGADSYIYEASDLIERFDKNYNLNIEGPKVVTYLSHPHWFNVDYPKLVELFNYIESRKVENGGEVVYATLKEVYDYFEKNGYNY